MTERIYPHYVEYVENGRKPLVTLWQSSRNWLRKNTKAGETIRLVNVFTRDLVKILVLTAPKTGMITGQSQWRSQKDASYSVRTDHKIECNRPDIVIVEKNLERSCTIIVIAWLFDHRISLKDQEEIEKYQHCKKRWSVYGTAKKLCLYRSSMVPDRNSQQKPFHV